MRKPKANNNTTSSARAVKPLVYGKPLASERCESAGGERCCHPHPLGVPKVRVPATPNDDSTSRSTNFPANYLLNRIILVTCGSKPVSMHDTDHNRCFAPKPTIQQP